MKSSKLEKVTTVLCRICEVGHWIGAVGLLVGFVLLVVMGEKAFIGGAPSGLDELSIYGFEITLTGADGGVDMAALRVFSMIGAFVMALMAMVFRNINLILKNSKDTTPFQPDNVRMVREIGWFLIAQPVVGLIGSIVVRLVSTAAEVNTVFNGGTIVVALVVLTLSQIFARGMELESDVDGLL